MVDAALTRLFHARMALGLFDDPKTVAYSTLGPDGKGYQCLADQFYL